MRKIDKEILRFAIKHIVTKGDTDIFPYPFELHFIRDCEETVASVLAEVDLSKYQPQSLVESLIPKTRYGFRVAHQHFPIDTIVYTALVIRIFESVERERDAPENKRAFSYRRDLTGSERLFLADRTYKDWLEFLQLQAFTNDFKYAIKTDISDFYMRIYRHRLENILASLSNNRSDAKTIESFIKFWRGGQSFGLPVGTDASRLLAEASLHDTDMALVSEGYHFSRYVDDLYILIRHDQDPYTALAFLAKHLSENEGLSLNNQKTDVLKWSDFISSNDNQDSTDEINKNEWATERLFLSAYGNEDLDEESLNLLMVRDLKKDLEEKLAEKYWDMGNIKVVLHAMRLVKDPNVSSYIIENIENLIPFAKDIFLLIEHFVKNNIRGFEAISDKIVDLVLSEKMKPLDCGRAWFLELGVRGIINFSQQDIRRLEVLTGTLDIRQLHLLRWRLKDINYFRSKKAKISEIQIWAQPSFIFAAGCLPHDEYNHWIRSLRSRLEFPLGKEFTDWCLSTYGTDPLKYRAADARGEPQNREAQPNAF